MIRSTCSALSNVWAAEPRRAGDLREAANAAAKGDGDPGYQDDREASLPRHISP
jgi:hypothetical protein